MTAGQGHLYVVEVSPGVCKIGRSVHRFSRLAAYASADRELLAWMSPKIDGYRGAETILIHRLAERFARAKGLETFHAPFAHVTQMARELIGAEVRRMGRTAA